MAQKVQILLVDDLDGGDASETVRFGLDGVVYEIDLSTEHAKELRTGLEPFAAAARRTSGSRPKQAKTSTGPSESAQIREWARANGYKPNDRGRIHKEIVDAYRAAN